MSENPPTGKSTGFDYDAWEEDLDNETLKQSMQVYYDQRASEYVDWFLRTGLYDRPETNEPFLSGIRQLEEELASFGEGRILEVACGIGWWTSLLAQSGREVVALDYGPRMLAECRKRLDLNETCAALVRASAYALPFADNSVDGCFFGFFFSHVPHEDVDPFLSEVRRVVRPGGRVCIFDSSLPSLDEVETEIQTRPLRDGSLHPALKVYYGTKGLARVLEPFAEQLTIKKVEGLFIAAHYRSRV